MMVWAVVLFVISLALPIEAIGGRITGVAIKQLLAGLSLFIAVYFLGYALILTKKLVEKYYR